MIEGSDLRGRLQVPTEGLPVIEMADQVIEWTELGRALTRYPGSEIRISLGSQAGANWEDQDVEDDDSPAVEDESLMGSWAEAQREALAILRRSLPAPASMVAPAAALAQATARLRAELAGDPERHRHLRRAAGWDGETPEDDTELWLGMTGALMAATPADIAGLVILGTDLGSGPDPGTPSRWRRPSYR